MSVDGILSFFAPNYLDLVAGVMELCAIVFAAGALAALIAWAVGYAVHSVYRWLDNSSEFEERG